MKKKLLSLTLALGLMLSAVGTVSASETNNISGTGTIDRTVDIPVSASRTANYTISIPKTLILVYNDATRVDEGQFKMTISGDVSGETEVKVSVIQAFDMVQDGKTNVNATTVIAEDEGINTVLSTSDSTYWYDVANYSDISAENGYNLYCKVSTASKLSAGSWAGSLGFKVAVSCADGE